MKREEIVDQVLDMLVEEAIKALGKDGDADSNDCQGARKGSKGRKTDTIKGKGGSIN